MALFVLASLTPSARAEQIPIDVEASAAPIVRSAERVVESPVGELIGLGVLCPGDAGECPGRESIEQLAHALNKRT